MNNLYLQERLVELKRRELEKEHEQARLLREAGLSKANLLARVAGSLRNFRAASRERLQSYRSREQKSY